jgi:hypothetical protein
MKFAILEDDLINYRPFLLRRFGEMGENRRRFIRTFIKRSPKNAK